MSQRRSSYDAELPRRTPSSSSLSSRRFRKTPDRPAAPTPRMSARRTTNPREWSSNSSSDDDGDDEGNGDKDHFRRTASVRSTRSFPTTMRGAIMNSPSRQKPSMATTMRGGRQRRCSDPVVHVPVRPPPRHHHQDHIDSGGSGGSSELESIAEDAATKTPLQIPEEEDLSSGPEDTFEFTRTGVGGRVGGGELLLIPTKHVPLPRSVSPAKSALRHGAHSEAGSTRHARVSFSDEDSIASFSAYSWPALVVAVDEAPRTLPVFARVGRGGGGVSMAGLAASESGSPGGGVGVPEVLMPEALVPEVVLTMPTPSSEEPPRSAAAIIERDIHADPDSDSGDSIYEDAYEDLPTTLFAPMVLNAPPALLNAPPLPPDFLRQQLLQPHPSPTSSSASSFSPPSSDTASIHSVSSFRRLTPRPCPRRPGMLRSLRVVPPPLTLPPHPPSPHPDPRPENDTTTALLSPAGSKLQRNRTWSGSDRGGSGGGGGGGFWRVFSKREVDGRSVIVKKSARGKDVWAGGGDVTTVIEGGSEKEETAQVQKKKKRFGKLKKLLRLG